MVQTRQTDMHRIKLIHRDRTFRASLAIRQCTRSRNQTHQPQHRMQSLKRASAGHVIQREHHIAAVQIVRLAIRAMHMPSNAQQVDQTVLDATISEESHQTTLISQSLVKVSMPVLTAGQMTLVQQPIMELQGPPVQQLMYWFILTGM